MHFNAHVAQSAERRLGKAEVVGSIPIMSSNYIHLEMQNRIEKDFEQRVAYYENKMVSYLGKAEKSVEFI